MKLHNIYLGIKDQLPLPRLFRNIKSGNVFGLFFIRSHQNESGKLKVMYNTKASATKAAESMAKKKGVHFSNYKCIFCDGYHLGKNRDNKTVTEPTSVVKYCSCNEPCFCINGRPWKEHEGIWIVDQEKMDREKK